MISRYLPCGPCTAIDAPQYTNLELPFNDFFAADEPHVPADNPTGLYRTSFTIPSDWQGKRLVLEFAGVEAGCFAVWLNGQAVGLGKDSRLPSAFDITELVQEGANTWRCSALNGLTRPTSKTKITGANMASTAPWYTATDHAYIQDLFCTAVLTIKMAQVYFTPNEPWRQGRHGWQFRTQLFDPQGNAVAEATQQAEIPFRLFGHHGDRDHIGVIDVELAQVQAWNHEQPHLYQVVVELLNQDGDVIEATSCRLGFRSVVIENKELKVNGEMVYIRGVNRHDHHDRTGMVLTKADIEQDLRVMKEHHINAIRCSHYPNDPMFYDLCDEHGFLVVDEANIESHHTYARTSHNPRYALAFLDRGMRMVQRDRNHPCIISWSTGNESGYGPNHDAMVGWMRRADPTRIMHEGAICSWVGQSWGN